MTNPGGSLSESPAKQTPIRKLRDPGLVLDDLFLFDLTDKINELIDRINGVPDVR